MALKGTPFDPMNWMTTDPYRASTDPDYALSHLGAAVYDPKTNWIVHTAERGNNSSSEPSEIKQLIDSLVSMSNQQTEAQNQLQLQMMREANAVTVAEGKRQREFNSAEALKAFQRSEQSRLAAQEYNTSERLSAQEWQEHMSNTQYQRAVKDLYEAGLNPLLAVGAQATYGGVSPGRSSASQGYAASSSAGHGNSASAYRSNVESLINGVLTYLTLSERNEIEKDGQTLGFLGKIFGSLLGTVR